MGASASGCLALDAVQGFIRGTLDAGQADRIEEHLDGCAECRSLVAALARDGAGLGAASTMAAPAASAAEPLALAATGFDLAAPDRAATPGQSLVGTTLADTYQLVRIIGKGGMGTIYEAHHARLRGKRYALKLLAAQVARQPEILARFRREAEIASQLGNEHIVEAHDFNISDGRAYMVMELLDGEDLADRIRRRGALPVGDVMCIVDQLASALDAAHRAQIVHRDLKPPNIYLCRRGGRDDYVKVLDFGLSKVLDSMTVVTRDFTLLGTPAYMSPEQAEGRIQQIDSRADVFALGAITWEMLTGTMAFGAPTFHDVLHKVRFVDPPDVHLVRRDLPAEVSKALRRALAKDRLARTPAVAELAGELAAALRWTGVVAGMSPSRGGKPAQASLGLAATAAGSPGAPPAAAPDTGRVAMAGTPTQPGPFAPAQQPLAPQPPAQQPLAPQPPAPQPLAPQPFATQPVLPQPYMVQQPAVSPHPVAPGAMHATPAIGTPGPLPAATPWPPPSVSHASPPTSKGLVIALVVGGVIAVGIWVAVAISMSQEPEVAPRPAAPAEPATAEPATAEPAPVAPETALIALTFTVEPASAAARIHVDGKLIANRQVRIERSGQPVGIVAEAKGYRTVRTQVVPERDRTVAIEFHKRSRTRTRSSSRPAARPKPAATVAAPRPAATGTPAAPPPAAKPAAAVPEVTKPVAKPAVAAPEVTKPEAKPAVTQRPAQTAAPRPRAKPAPKPAPKPAKRRTGTIFDQ
ncbi:MAG TPA: protein kinase [Kofleriaceae bacterium]|nr:protein kinase [Kofleriaceae bacterium]